MILRKRRFWAFLIGVPLSLLLIGSVSITLTGLDDNLHAADLAVVLGNKVQPDGRPSLMLKARLDHTVDLYRLGYFKRILVSGGHGREGYDEPIVMREYLETQGIPHGAIIEDNDGYTTWMTARNTSRILSAHHLQSVLVISQYFHMSRCRLALSKFGITPIYTSHAPFWSVRDFYSVPREVIGYADYSIRRPGDAGGSDNQE